MNSTKTSCHKEYSAYPYFSYNLRHNVYQLAIYIVVVILSMILPCVIEVSRQPMIRPNYSYDNLMTTIGGIGFVLSGLMGLFSGMSALSYVNDKQNVTCLHSFPLKRTSIFLCEVPAGFIYYIISIAVGFVSAYAITSIPGPHDKNTIFTYLCIILASVFLYLLVNSAALLAAGLTGTGVARFLMTALILFFPITLYALIISDVNVGFKALNCEYYLSMQATYILCPAVRLVRCITNESIGYISYLFDCLRVLPYIAVYYAGAFMLHKYRRTEATGKTIIWKPVFAVTKYIVIFAGALLGILIFGSGIFTAANGVLDVIFGAIIGLVLSYIVVNSILYRSTRSMFKDFKKFLVMSAAVIVFALIVPANVFGWIGGIYSEGNTKSIVFTVDGVEVELGGNDILAETEKYLKHELYGYGSVPVIKTSELWSENDDAYLREHFSGYAKSDYEKNVYYDGYADTEESIVISYDERFRYVEVVQKPKFGIPLAFNIYISDSSIIWEKILLSDEYKQQKNVSEWLDRDSFYEMELMLGEVQVNAGVNGFTSYNDNNTYFEDGYVAEDRAVERLMNNIIDSCVYNEDEIRNSPIVGNIYIYYKQENGKNNSVAYPISVGQLDLLNCSSELIAYIKKEAFTPYSSADEYYTDVFENCSAAVMVDTETGEARRVDVNDIVAHADETVSLSSTYYWEYSQYTPAEDVGYIFITANEDGTTSEIIFRRGAADHDELTKLFKSLK